MSTLNSLSQGGIELFVGLADLGAQSPRWASWPTRAKWNWLSVYLTVESFARAIHFMCNIIYWVFLFVDEQNKIAFLSFLKLNICVLNYNTCMLFHFVGGLVREMLGFSKKIICKVCLRWHHAETLFWVVNSSFQNRFFSELFATQKRISTWCHRKQTLLFLPTCTSLS